MRPPRAELRFAPRRAFETVLQWAVIPTFDLVVEFAGPAGDRVAIARRRIAPYKATWALPGLRMYKPESIDQTLSRIASDELGVAIDLDTARYIGQYVGRFRTEHERQDLSTGYAVRALDSEPRLNENHFSSFRLISAVEEIPTRTGAMYRHYLERYFHGDMGPPRRPTP